MEKIDFIDNVTKGNAETFNTMQDNIEKTLNIYSADEIIIGTWFGKPLYRKLIHTGVIDIQATYFEVQKPDNMDILTKFVFNGKESFAGFGWIYGNYYTLLNGTERYHFTQYNSDGHLYVAKNSNATYRDSYIILEYTKTTD